MSHTARVRVEIGIDSRKSRPASPLCFLLPARRLSLPPFRLSRPLFSTNATSPHLSPEIYEGPTPAAPLPCPFAHPSISCSFHQLRGPVRPCIPEGKRFSRWPPSWLMTTNNRRIITHRKIILWYAQNLPSGSLSETRDQIGL